jgi:DNA modification methylase
MSGTDTAKGIDYAIVPKTHPPMYLMHKYWARKPHNVVSEYIQKYSKAGEIIFDPFSGSGVTAVEAIKAGRKGVAIDLNPVSSFMTRCTAIPLEMGKFHECFTGLEKKCKEKINGFYETVCPRCKGRAFLAQSVWAKDKKEDKLEKVKKIWFECPACGKKGEKKIEDFDLKIIKKTESTPIKHWYPKTRLAYNGNEFQEGTHDAQIDSIDKLFTKRNLRCLALLMSEIEKISNKKNREMMKFVFTSALEQTSKLNSIDMRAGREWMTRGWTIHRYWIPIGYLERNVWNCFEERFHKALRGKKQSNEIIKNYNEADKFSELQDSANIYIKTCNAMRMKEFIPPDSVDYIFTDPPYGGAIQYFELSTLWAAWLKFELDYEGEITVNRNQGKDFDFYHKMLMASFRQMYQILKAGKYLTVTFHSTEIKVWNSIIKAVVMVGFDLEKIIYQPPAMPSAKGQLQPYGSAVGDYYIRFKKPLKESLKTEKEMDLKTYEMDVIDSTRRIIGERGEPTIYQHILNGIMADLQAGKNVPVGAKNIEEVLKAHIGKEFEIVPVCDSKGEKIGNKWWIKGWEISHFSRPSLTDRVEKVVVNVLQSRIKVSFDDILQAIFMEFPNALTPDTQNLKSIIEEYSRAAKDGNWILKADVKKRESQHAEMIYYLAKIGAKARFDVWVGQREQGDAFSNEKLSSLVTDKSPVWRYITGEPDRVKQIDVLWHDRGKINYQFEVENTTAITEAIARGSNIESSRFTKRLIVIPEERQAFLFRKMQEPLLKESVIANNWKFIFYKDVTEFYKNNINKDRIDLENFEKLFKYPSDEKYNPCLTFDFG